MPRGLEGVPPLDVPVPRRSARVVPKPGTARLREPVRRVAAECQRYGGLFAGTYFQALDSYLNHPAQVVVTGDLRDPLAVELRRAALTTYHPGRSVLPADGGYVPDAAKAMLDSPLAKDGPVAFLCKGTVCAPPTADPEALRKLLSTP